MLNAGLSRIMGIGEVQRQSLISLFWQIATTFFGFLGMMYFARVVGASVLGAYFLVLAYYGIISIITDGGFGGAAVKRISEGVEKNAYFTAFFVMHSLSIVITLVVLIIFRNYFVDLNSAGTFIWLLLAIIASLFYRSVTIGIAGCGKIGIYATCDFINNFLRILIQVAAVFLGFGVAGLAGGLVAGMLAATIIAWHFFDLNLVSFTWQHIKSLTTFSFWLFLTSGGVMIYSYADKVMIGYYLNNADVGVYQIVWQLVTVGTFTTSVLRGTLWPKVSMWGKTGETELVEESLSSAFSYSLILAVPVLAGGVLLGDKLLYFFYGSEFAIGYSTLVIVLIVQVVNVFQYFFTMYLDALDRPKESFKVTAVAVIANIILNMLLIPVIGIVGAASATLLTMILNAVLAQRKLSQIMNIRLEHDSLLNILKASIVMSLFLGSYRLIIPLSNVWLTLVPVVLGAVLYGILVLKFDTKIYNDLREIAIKMNLPWPKI